MALVRPRALRSPPFEELRFGKRFARTGMFDSVGEVV
jgi:hypothetical protein